MRPEKAWRVIETSIKNAIRGDVTTLYTKQTWLALNKLLSKLKVELANSFDEHYSHYSPESKEYVEARNELVYISDRFNAPHRVKWLMFGIENKLFTLQSVTEEYSEAEVQELVLKANCQESHAKMFLLKQKGLSATTIASRFGYSEMTIGGYIKKVKCGLVGKSYCMLEHYNPSTF